MILVVAEHLLGEVKQLLSGSSLPPLGDLRLEFVSLGTVAENWGTADVLRHISDRIKVSLRIFHTSQIYNASTYNVS